MNKAEEQKLVDSATFLFGIVGRLLAKLLVRAAKSRIISPDKKSTHRLDTCGELLNMRSIGEMLREHHSSDPSSPKFNEKTLRKWRREGYLPAPEFGAEGTHAMRWSKRLVANWICCDRPPFSQWMHAGKPVDEHGFPCTVRENGEVVTTGRGEVGDTLQSIPIQHLPFREKPGRSRNLAAARQSSN